MASASAFAAASVLAGSVFGGSAAIDETGLAIASNALRPAATGKMRVMVSLFVCECANGCDAPAGYVSGTARTVSNETVTFGSVVSIPSIAVGGLMP